VKDTELGEGGPRHQPDTIEDEKESKFNETIWSKTNCFIRNALWLVILTFHACHRIIIIVLHM